MSKPSTQMKISCLVTIVILLAALTVGIWDGKRLEEAGRRLEARKAEKMARPVGDAHERALAVKDRDEHAKVSAAELMKWLPSFEGKEGPEALASIYQRLESLTTAEVEYILGEYLEGRGLKGYPGPLLFNVCMVKMATDDPLKAIDFFDAFRKKWKSWRWLGEMGGQVIGDAVIAMAKDDPAKAADWLRVNAKKFDSQISEHTKRVMLFHVAATDPGRAFGLLEELGIAGKSQAVMSIIWAAKTDEERAKMLTAFRHYERGISDEGVRNEVKEKALAAFGERLSQQGAEAASRWVASAELTKEEVGALVGGIVASKHQGEMRPWVDWIGRTVSPEAADEPVRTLFARWTETDYQASGQWLVAMSPGPVREMAVQAYAETAAKYDPLTAAQWAETLSVGERRNLTIRKVYENWPKDERADRSAAADFAKRHGLE